MLGHAAALAAEGASERQRRLIQNCRKLKSKVMDTATLLELYTQAQEREKQLEARIVQLEGAARAARTASNGRLEELQKRCDAMEAEAKRAADSETAKAVQLTEARGTIEQLRASLRDQQRQMHRQQQRHEAAAAATAVSLSTSGTAATNAASDATFQLPCSQCAAAAREVAKERAAADEAKAAKASAERALLEAERSWEQTRSALEASFARAAANAANAAATAAAHATNHLPLVSNTADENDGHVHMAHQFAGSSLTKRARLSGGEGVRARGGILSIAYDEDMDDVENGGGGDEEGDLDEAFESYDDGTGRCADQGGITDRRLSCGGQDEVRVGRTVMRFSLLPKDVRQTARRGTITQAIGLLEGELVRWAYSPCALRDSAAERQWPPVGVSIEASGYMDGAINELQELLCARGSEFMAEWVHRLASQIVGTRRAKPMRKYELQRAVLHCHLFARCCRTLDDGSNRVRLLCYDLARFRAYMEPALLAALACSWPSPLLTEGWEPDPNDDDVNGTPSFGNGTVGGSICDEHGGGRVLDEAVSPLPAELLPAAALAPAFARPGGATLAVLDLRCQRLLASTRIGLERSLHERACALLAQHGGRGWSLPLPAAVAQPPNVATATATPVHDVASPAATAATAATGSASALRQNSSAIAISATSTAHSDAARELKLIAQFLRGALPTEYVSRVAATPGRPTGEPEGPGESGGSSGSAGGRGRSRAPRAYNDEALRATQAAIEAAAGSSRVAPRQVPARPGRAAGECCRALELIAAGRGWQWTVDTLIRAWILPLLREAGGRSALLRLLGKLGSLSPSPSDSRAVWLRGQLRACIAAGAPFGPVEQQAAISALLELLPTSGGLGARAEDAEAVREMGRWQRAQPTSWQAVPAALKDKYHALARRLEA